MRLFAPIQITPSTRRRAKNFESYLSPCRQQLRRMRRVIISAGLAGKSFGRREEQEVVGWLSVNCQQSPRFRVDQTAKALNDYIIMRGGDTLSSVIRFANPIQEYTDNE